jgi:hypothetical protein
VHDHVLHVHDETIISSRTTAASPIMSGKQSQTVSKQKQKQQQQQLIWISGENTKSKSTHRVIHTDT